MTEQASLRENDRQNAQISLSEIGYSYTLCRFFVAFSAIFRKYCQKDVDNARERCYNDHDVDYSMQIHLAAGFYDFSKNRSRPAIGRAYFFS